MTVLDALKSIKTFLADTIKTQNITLQQEETDSIYTIPYVEICYYPHKNFMPGGFQAPGILVSLDETNDGPSDHQASIRLICTAYGGGYYKDAEGIDTGIPDAKGYIDLLNFMERLKIAITAQRIIGSCTVNKPVTMGMYDTEPSWPYWYGYLTFDVELPATEFVINRETEDFLHGL